MACGGDSGKPLLEHISADVARQHVHNIGVALWLEPKGLTSSERSSVALHD